MEHTPDPPQSKSDHLVPRSERYKGAGHMRLLATTSSMMEEGEVDSNIKSGLYRTGCDEFQVEVRVRAQHAEKQGLSAAVQ